MAFRIKPEDVPEEITRKGLTPQFVVDVLEAAIEAGLVSPPCWDAYTEMCVPNNMVHKTKTHCDEIVAELNRFYEETGSVIRRHTRHWKGQTS